MISFKEYIVEAKEPNFLNVDMEIDKSIKNFDKVSKKIEDMLDKAQIYWITDNSTEEIHVISSGWDDVKAGQKFADKIGKMKEVEVDTESFLDGDSDY